MLTLAILFSCARVPQQVVEVPEERSGFTVVRVEGRYGAASGFFVARSQIAKNMRGPSHIRSVSIKSSPTNKTTGTVEVVTAFDVKNDLLS